MRAVQEAQTILGRDVACRMNIKKETLLYKNAVECMKAKVVSGENLNY